MAASESPTRPPPAPAPDSPEAPSRASAGAQPQPLSILSGISARLGHALRGLRATAPIRERLEEVIEESALQSEEISSEERFMLGNLLKFGELRVEDVMVPRADIVAVEENTSLGDLLDVFREAQHSRLPIYRETLDDPLGMVHIKDVIALMEKDGSGLRWQEVLLAKIKRDVIFVPASMPVLDLLLKMQASRIHLALVVDEYGGTDGLVSIEDLVEEIVGDIDDEHDVDEAPAIVARGNGSFDADARADLDDLKERTGIDLTVTHSDEDVDTLGGLVFAELGRVPARGEIIVLDEGFEFEVLEADARRVKRLRIRPVSSAGPAAATG